MRVLARRVRYWRLQISLRRDCDASSDEREVPSEPSTTSRGHDRRSHVMRRASAVSCYPLSMLGAMVHVKIASAAAHTKAAHNSCCMWRQWHRRGEIARSSRITGPLLR